MSDVLTEPIELLLVDDNEDDIILTQEAFATARVLNVIHVARDGYEALRFLRREGPHRNASKPGMILLDINLPGKTGLEVLEEMKTDSTLRGIPVVMLTVSGNESDVARAYASGACSYIRKPVSFEEFQKVVQRFSVYWSLVARLPAPIG